MPAANPAMTVAHLSSLPETGFVAALDGIYEHSPWVAAAAWRKRPFRTLAELHNACRRSVGDAGPEMQLGLVRAHPELAGKAAVEGRLTSASTREQSGAGLDQCSSEEFEQLTRLNHDYREKFGFPFIIAVRGHTRAGILAEFERRLRNAPDQELRECLRQVDRIALLRLEERITDAPAG